MKNIKHIISICLLVLLASCTLDVADPITYVVKDSTDSTPLQATVINGTALSGYHSAPNADLDIVVTFTFPEGLTLGSDLNEGDAVPTGWYVLDNKGHASLADDVTVTVYEDTPKGSNTLKVRIFCDSTASCHGMLTFAFADAFQRGNYTGMAPDVAFCLVKVTDPITFVVKDSSDTTPLQASVINGTALSGYHAPTNENVDFVVTFTFPEGFTLGSDLNQGDAVPAGWYVLDNKGHASLADDVAVTVYADAAKGSNTLKVRIYCNYPGNCYGALTFAFADDAFQCGHYTATAPLVVFCMVKAS